MIESLSQDSDLIATLGALFLGLLISGLLGYALQQLRLSRFRRRRQPGHLPGNQPGYRATMQELGATLESAAGEFDDVIAEMMAVAEARQRAAKDLEKRLDELAAQEAELQSDNADHGDESVLQGVSKENGALGQAFGARGANVTLLHDIEHAGTHQPGHGACGREPKNEGWQNEVGHSSFAGGWQPAQDECK